MAFETVKFRWFTFLMVTYLGFGLAGTPRDYKWIEDESQGNFNVSSPMLTNYPSDENIVFPGRRSDSTKNVSLVFNGQRPPCAKDGLTFCEHIDSYPSAHVQQLHGSYIMYSQNSFGVDELQDAIAHRINILDESPLCVSEEKIVFPKVAQNSNNQWLYVVNDDRYKQGVRVEICRAEGQSCTFSEYFPHGYKTMCQQKYIYRKMVAVNDQGDTISDSFRLPSCCSCIVRMEIQGDF